MRGRTVKGAANRACYSVRKLAPWYDGAVLNHRLARTAARLGCARFLTCIGLLTCMGAGRVSAENPPAQWDGLDALRAEAEADGVDLVVAESHALSALSAADALLLVGPRMQMPIPEIAAFLREGGRVALLDDMGSGARMLATYQVQRERPPEDVPALRGNRDWLFAYPAIEHPLTEGVPVLLTNRAVALSHPDLKPVFTFGANGPALVLSGAVGPGRLVIIGDASLLINQLLTLPSHRRFAHNLLAYLARPGGRIYLVGPTTVLRGQYGSTDGDRRHDWNDALKRLSHPQLPGSALLWVAFGLAAAAALLGLALLPRKSPYARHALVDALAIPAGRAQTQGGAEHARDYTWEALELNHELLAALRSPLELRGDESLAELTQRFHARGVSEEDARRLGQLLGDLRRVAAGVASPFRRRVLGNDLLQMIRLGEALLAKIGRDPR